MERLGGLAEIPLEPGILRALVAVDVKGDIPGLLIAQTPPLGERHVALDEGGRLVDAVHARAPVVALLAPQGREDVAIRHLLALPLTAVAIGTALGIDALAPLEIGGLGRGGDGEEVAPGQLVADGGTARISASSFVIFGTNLLFTCIY